MSRPRAVEKMDIREKGVKLSNHFKEEETFYSTEKEVNYTKRAFRRGGKGGGGGGGDLAGIYCIHSLNVSISVRHLPSTLIANQKDYPIGLSTC